MRERIINIVIILVSLFIGVIGTLFFVNNFNNNKTGVVNKNVTITEQDSINEAVLKIYDSVVVISNYRGDKLSGYGSGFIYKKDNKYGYIMTNNHVVENADKINITLSSGEEVEASVLGSDSYADIAVLRISSDKVLGVAHIGDSTNAKLGDTVFTVGSPVGPDYAGSVTKGIISGEGREITIGNAGDESVMEAIQIDASINPGNSGGPLVNINGEVIGVNSIKLVENSIEGMGFAIPIEVAMSQVEKLEKGEKIKRPVIGVSLYDIDNVALLYRNGIKIDDTIKNGVIVNAVEKDSDAEKCGLQDKDIIIKADGKDVKSSAHLKFILYKHDIGDSIKLVINRDGKEKELTIKLTHVMGD